MDEKWLMPGAVVPVDPDTTKALVDEIKRLIGIIGDLLIKKSIAEDAVAEEREACAKVCEERQEVFEKYYTKGLAAMCAETIRARSKQ